MAVEIERESDDTPAYAPLVGFAWGVLFGVLLWSAVGLVVLWLWR